MKRLLIVIGMLVAVASCGVVTWSVARPSLAVFLVPGATDIQITVIGWGQQISYRAPGAAYAWYSTLAHTLDAQHWILRNRWRPDAPWPTYNPIVPLQYERRYAEVLWEEVVLTPDGDDPQRATITVRQRMSIPWWRAWQPTGADESSSTGGVPAPARAGCWAPCEPRKAQLLCQAFGNLRRRVPGVRLELADEFD